MPQARQPAAVSTRDALVIKVVKGTATPAELAALTSVLLSRAAALAALGRGLQDRAPTPTATWRRPERVPAHRDPRGWRASGSRAA
ncbi:acyl-CoA carboxylase subunit epsilon [Streptomyces sp. TRM72054]|nr:acyl-CoA carboxylase subunit epsilon [Streptomyces sp. TRM72054]